MSFFKNISRKVKDAFSQKESPVFVVSQRKGGSTYEIYKSTNAESAKEFLSKQKVSKKLHYIVVETPEGNWGVDKEGLYLERLLPWQTDLSLASCEGGAMPADIFSLKVAAENMNDNFIAIVSCGNCQTQWKDGIRFNDFTIVRCPQCKTYNKITSDITLFLVEPEGKPADEKTSDLRVISYDDWLVEKGIPTSPMAGNLFWFAAGTDEVGNYLEIRQAIYPLFIPSPPLRSPLSSTGQKQFIDELNIYEGVIKPELIDKIPHRDNQWDVTHYAKQRTDNIILGIAVHGDMQWQQERNSIISQVLSVNSPDIPLEYLGMTTFIKRDNDNPNSWVEDGSLHTLDGYARGIGLKRVLTLTGNLVRWHESENILSNTWFINNGYKIIK